jgi:uridine kinase
VSDERGAVVGTVADYLVALHLGRPVLTCIDGRSAAGKSTFSAKLCDEVVARGRACVRVEFDGFHTPGHKFRSMRREYTHAGYLNDAWDFVAVRERVLLPLTAGGDGVITPGAWDSYHDEPFDPDPIRVPDDAVVVVDGGPSWHPLLDAPWDVAVWLHIEFATMIERAVVRDVAWVGDAEVVREKYENVYVGMHELYESTTGAPDRADFFIDNGDPSRPRLLRAP